MKELNLFIFVANMEQNTVERGFGFFKLLVCINQLVSRAIIFISGAEGLRFKSHTSQIGHCVAQDLLQCSISLERVVLFAGAIMQRWVS